MAEIPVKPISEIEVKEEVSENDKILILDSESEEARLASKEELRWPQGEQGEQWIQGIQWPKWDKGDKGDKWEKWEQWEKGETWETWPQWIQGEKWPKGDKWDKWDTWDTWPEWPEWPQWPQWEKGDKWDKGSKWDKWDTWDEWPKWDKWDTWDEWPKGDTGNTWPQWPTWPQGQKWDTGNGIASITHNKSWKNTTVTITNTDWTWDSFVIQDWADWQGSWDMLASVYDPSGVADDAFDYNNMKNTPSIPSTAADVDALPDTTKYWASLDLSLNTTTYVITAQLKDQDGNALGSPKTVDLPLESVVVSGSYNAQTKEVELVLENWTKITFSVADLVAWLQTEITSTNKLDSDLVDDSQATHKFVTTTEKSTWNWKQDAIQDLATIRLNASAWASAASTIANYWNIVSHNANEFAAATHTHQISDVSWLQTALNWKAASTHSHAIADVTWLPDALANKADASDLTTLEGTVSDLSDEVDWKIDYPSWWTVWQALKKTASGSEWWDISWLPTGWTEWQVVTKTNDWAEWANPTWWSTTITVTLTSAWWSSKTQTVSATGVTASNSVIVSPAPSSLNDYAINSVYCESQASWTLTFKCNTVPTDAITVNVLILS